MVKARECPMCDGEVTRWRKLEEQAAIREEIMRSIDLTPFEVIIADTFAPVPPLPNPYYLRAATGEVQIFRIPAHLQRRRARRRR